MKQRKRSKKSVVMVGYPRLLFTFGHGKCTFKGDGLAWMPCRPPISDQVLAAHDVASKDPHTKRSTRRMGLRRTKVRYERAYLDPETGTGNRTRSTTHRNTDEGNESVPFADATIEFVVMPSLTVPTVRLRVIANENERGKGRDKDTPRQRERYRGYHHICV